MNPKYMNPPPGAPGGVVRADGSAEVPVMIHEGGVTTAAHGSPHARNLVRVRMTGELLVYLMTAGVSIPPQAQHLPRRPSRLVVRRGLPAGAELIDARYVSSTNVHVFLFRHDSFEPVPDCKVPPVLPVEYDLVYDALPADVAG